MIWLCGGIDKVHSKTKHRGELSKLRLRTSLTWFQLLEIFDIFAVNSDALVIAHAVRGRSGQLDRLLSTSSTSTRGMN